MATFARPLCRRCKGYFGFKKGVECCMDCGIPRETDNPQAVAVEHVQTVTPLIANEETYGHDTGRLPDLRSPEKVSAGGDGQYRKPAKHKR